MKRGLSFLIVLVAGLGVGYVLGSGGRGQEPPRGSPMSRRTASPAPPAPATLAPAPRKEEGPTREDLLARIRDLERELDAARSSAASSPQGGDTRPVRVLGDSGDPEKGKLVVHAERGNGAPGEAIRVHAYLATEGGSTQQAEAQIGPDGAAELASLEPGRWYVTVSTPGGSLGITAVVPRGRTVEVRMPEERGAASVEGAVRDATKGPLGKVNVTLVRSAGLLQDTRTARTDAEGRFSFRDVPEGRWQLSASGGTLGFDRQPKRTVTVPAEGRVVQDLVVGVESLRGLVRDRSTGAPVPGVRVSIQSGVYRSATSDADGIYRFLDLPPGKYELVVSKNGYGIRFLRGVEVGTEATDHPVDLDPAATLRIEVTCPDGRPYLGRLFFGINPKNRGEGTSVGTSVDTDDAGRAAYRKIVPGEYVLHFQAEGVGKATLETRVGTGENFVSVRLE